MRYETLVCDKCHKEARVPTRGWIATKASKGSATEPAGEIEGDFCSPSCIVQHFGNVAIQAGLEDAADQASQELSD